MSVSISKIGLKNGEWENRKPLHKNSLQVVVLAESLPVPNESGAVLVEVAVTARTLKVRYFSMFFYTCMAHFGGYKMGYVLL